MEHNRRRRAKIVDGSWGGRFEDARIRSGVEVNAAATKLGIADARFRELLERYEALPEAPRDPLERARAGCMLVQFGIDPAEFGIAEEELDVRRARKLRDSHGDP